MILSPDCEREPRQEINWIQLGPIGRHTQFITKIFLYLYVFVCVYYTIERGRDFWTQPKMEVIQHTDYLILLWPSV